MIAALLTLLAGALVVVAISALTGWFVAQEFAYMAVDRSRMGARAAAGDAGARRVLGVTGRTSFMLSGAQLGITVTGLLVGYVAEPLIGASLGTLLGGVGIPTGVGIAVGTVLALAVSTLVQMLFGELFPKNLAIARPEPVAVALSRSTLLYLRVTGWLIWVFDQSSNLLLRALRIEPVHDVAHAATRRDLEHIVTESGRTGDLSPQLSGLLERVLDFPTRDVEHAMVPRTRLDVVDRDLPLERVRELMAAGHSRYPVVDAEQRVVGVVHLLDLLAPATTGATTTGPATAGDAMRDVVVLPTLMSLPDALAELTAAGEQLAVVVDEHGGLVGALTVEDLAEELVGEIVDEHDEEPLAPVRDGDAWLVPGGLPVDELARTTGLVPVLDDADFETHAGLVIARLGRLPDVGTVVLAADEPGAARLTVLEVEDHVPSLVRIELTADVAASTAPGADEEV